MAYYIFVKNFDFYYAFWLKNVIRGDFTSATQTADKKLPQNSQIESDKAIMPFCHP